MQDISGSISFSAHHQQGAQQVAEVGDQPAAQHAQQAVPPWRTAGPAGRAGLGRGPESANADTKAGGSDDLSALDHAGKLDALLHGA